MKALRIGKLIKRNKKQNFALDSMVEIIVHFLLGHARDSREKTKVLQGDHQYEHTEDYHVKLFRNEGFPHKNLYQEEASIVEANAEEAFDEKAACDKVEGISLIGENTEQKKMSVTKDPDLFNHDLRGNTSIVSVPGSVSKNIASNIARCDNDQGSQSDARQQYHETILLCDTEKQYDKEQLSDLELLKNSDNEIQIICKLRKDLVSNKSDEEGSKTQRRCSLLNMSAVNGVLTRENSVIYHHGSSLEESEMDSASDSCASVIDLLKDECWDNTVTADIFRKESAVVRKNYSAKSKVSFAQMERCKNVDMERRAYQILDTEELEKSKEETEEMEKWASERPEKYDRYSEVTVENWEKGNKEEPDVLQLLSEEEVVPGAPSRLGVGTPRSRPDTQESAAHRLLWLHEESRDGRGDALPDGGGGSGRRSPDLLHLAKSSGSSQAAGVKKMTFDAPLDTLRSGPELRNGLFSPVKSHSNGHIPNGLSNGSVNGHARRNGNVSSGSVPLAVQGKSVFDTDADVDIATVAAQRDQLRGSKNIRGMMAPVMSKEEDPRSRSANRRMILNKQRSESVLGDQEVSESKEDVFPSTEYREGGSKSNVHGNLVGRRGVGENGQVYGLPLGGLGEIGLRPPGDYLDANRRSDIMAQSMRRQSLRGSKQSLLDSNYSSFESNTSSRLSMGEPSPEEFKVFQPDGGKYPVTGEGHSEAKRKNLPRFIPSSHEDIQILNLQGFMDAAGVIGDGSGISRRKHKKKRIKRAMEMGHMDKARETYKFHARPRRKRTHKLSKSLLSDDDGEVMLKDIDDLDSKVAGLVIGPEHTSKESSGRPITLEEASDLRNILTGSPAQPLPTEWLSQNFVQNTNPNLSYGLVQKKGGPCGVLACVQAYMMKCLIFGTIVAPNTSPVSPLRPSQREWSWSLGAAITEILWKAGQEQKAVLAMPGSFAHFTEHGIGRYSQDGMTENLTLHEYVEQQDLHEAVTRHLTAFTSETSSGCVILLYSLIFTRGIKNIHSDMDSGGGHLINAHGYSSQEIVNLLLTGRAFTNTFNGDHTLGNNAGQSVVLHGIMHKGEIGLLSLFEHYDCYKVGTYLKCPQYPIWVVCCESHYSCLFSRDTSVTSDIPSASKFDLYYYDGLALQEDEIRLTLDLDGDDSDLTIVPPLEHCIRTKWKKASVDWNGTDPIL